MDQEEVKSRAHVITVSDRSSADKTLDTSGPAVVEILMQRDFEVSGPEIVPDEQKLIAETIVAAVNKGANLIVTTGGTGLGPRDVTPQATVSVIDYEVSGIGELMRRAGETMTPMAALSRSIAGVRGSTLIINVPGSLKGAIESLDAVVPLLPHALKLLRGDTRHE
jgi:molybdenum cofactor synthesis domain-containing protein